MTGWSIEFHRVNCFFFLLIKWNDVELMHRANIDLIEVYPKKEVLTCGGGKVILARWRQTAANERTILRAVQTIASLRECILTPFAVEHLYTSIAVLI